jgi:uncharacterized protein YukE
MAQLGADVEQLDQLSRKLREEGSKLESTVGQISGQIKSTWWKGTDADTFKSEWDGQFSAQLRNVATALNNAGDAVRKQAEQQRTTSNA